MNFLDKVESMNRLPQAKKRRKLVDVWYILYYLAWLLFLFSFVGFLAFKGTLTAVLLSIVAFLAFMLTDLCEGVMRAGRVV